MPPSVKDEVKDAINETFDEIARFLWTWLLLSGFLWLVYTCRYDIIRLARDLGYGGCAAVMGVSGLLYSLWENRRGGRP